MADPCAAAAYRCSNQPVGSSRSIDSWAIRREATSGSSLICSAFFPKVWTDVDRTHGLHRINVRGPLVLAIANHPGEPQRHPGRVARRRLHPVERDLNHHLRAQVDSPVIPPYGELLEALRLPPKELVRQPLERLPEHDELARLLVARTEMQVRQPARPTTMTPLRREH